MSFASDSECFLSIAQNIFLEITAKPTAQTASLTLKSGACAPQQNGSSLELVLYALSGLQRNRLSYRVEG